MAEHYIRSMIAANNTFGPSLTIIHSPAMPLCWLLDSSKRIWQVMHSSGFTC